MKSFKNAKSFFHSISFYLLVIFSIVTVLFAISCSDHNEVVEAPSVDYFDGSLIRYGDFIQSSIPAYGVDGNKITAQQNRAQIYWYNVAPSPVKVTDILGNSAAVDPQKSNVNVMDVVYDPSQKGIYNTAELTSELQSHWGGLFRALPDSVIKNFYKKNSIMKIWLKIDSAPPGAVLNIDIGKISEDIIPNGKLDTEDKNSNDLLDNGEDTGIDDIMDVLEPGYQNGNDPNNDDFEYHFGSGYERVNGSEGNGVLIDLGKKPDTEDLNRNYALDLINDYFSYIIPLDTNEIIQNKIVEYGSNGWLQLKIPVDLPDLKIGSPSLQNVGSLRIWITNANQPVHIKIAQIKFDEI